MQRMDSLSAPLPRCDGDSRERDLSSGWRPWSVWPQDQYISGLAAIWDIAHWFCAISLNTGRLKRKKVGVGTSWSPARVGILRVGCQAACLAQGRQLNRNPRGGPPYLGTRVTARSSLAGMRQGNGILIAQIKRASAGER